MQFWGQLIWIQFLLLAHGEISSDFEEVDSNIEIPVDDSHSRVVWMFVILGKKQQRDTPMNEPKVWKQKTRRINFENNKSEFNLIHIS